MKKNNKEETLKKWEELLDKMGLNDVSTTKINIARILDSDASRLINEKMSKERYNQIIDEVYENYTQTKIIKTDSGETHISPIGHYNGMTKEQFINKCKTDPEFSEKWGLKIEERELSFEERWDLSEKYGYRKKGGEIPSETETFNGVNEREEFNSMMNDPVMGTNLPTKLITLTYNNETIEVYEPIR